MAEFLTKSRARNIFYGGSIFFVVIFVAMAVRWPGIAAALEHSGRAAPSLGAKFHLGLAGREY